MRIAKLVVAVELVLSIACMGSGPVSIFKLAHYPCMFALDFQNSKGYLHLDSANGSMKLICGFRSEGAST
jgi:hypothetical protein